MHPSPTLRILTVPRMFTSTAGLTPCDFSTVARVCRLLCSPCTTSFADCGSFELNCIDDPPDDGLLPLEDEDEGFCPPEEDDEGLLLPPPPKLICPLIVEKMNSKSRSLVVFAIPLRLQTPDLFDNWSVVSVASWRRLDDACRRDWCQA